MCNSNYSNIVLQQERIHVDGILTAHERGITCVVRLGNENAQVYYLIWRKRPFPQLQRAEVLKWSQGLANLGLFEGKDTSSFTYQPCHRPQARVFCCWHGRKTPLGFWFLEVMTSTSPNPFCSTKSIAKEVSFQGFRTAEESLCLGECAEMEQFLVIKAPQSAFKRQKWESSAVDSIHSCLRACYFSLSVSLGIYSHQLRPFFFTIWVDSSLKDSVPFSNQYRSAYTLEHLTPAWFSCPSWILWFFGTSLQYLLLLTARGMIAWGGTESFSVFVFSAVQI